MKNNTKKSCLKFLILIAILIAEFTPAIRNAAISLIHQTHADLDKISGETYAMALAVLSLFREIIPIHIGIVLAITLPILTFFYLIYTKQNNIVYYYSSIILASIVLLCLGIVVGYASACKEALKIAKPVTISPLKYLIFKDIIVFTIKPIVFSLIVFTIHKLQVVKSQGSIYKKIFISILAIISGVIMVIGVDMGISALFYNLRI